MTSQLPPALNIIALTTFAASLSGRALDPVLPHVAEDFGVDRRRICSGERTREVVAARRAVVLCARIELGRELHEAAAAVGISAQGAGKLMRTASDEAREEAARIGGLVWVRAGQVGEH